VSNWNHYNPVRVIHQRGALANLAEHIPFDRVALVTTPGFTRRGVTGRIQQMLGDRLVSVLDTVTPNPGMEAIDGETARVRAARPDGVLAVGGGSSMDTAKALARLLSQPETASLAAHFRVGEMFQETPALPLVAVPTTAGTGSEVTPFATVWDHQNKKKHSVTGDDLYAHTALLDPELTLGLPDEVTVSSGLDAISHAFESTWNRNATPVSLSFATASLQLSLKALPALHENPEDLDQRAAMLQASTLAGMAISQTRTALAHSISYPLTAHFGLPHGIACSFTLPALLEFNAQVDDGRLARLAASLGCRDTSALADMLQTVLTRVDAGNIFRRYVPPAANAIALLDQMFTPGRANNNLRQAVSCDVEELLKGVTMHYLPGP
jgi:alcohol dehydrogenase